MILIDTNHLTVLKYPEDSEHETLVRRMEASAGQDFAIPIIVVEEQLRGWLAVIHSAREERKQINAYARLSDLILFFGSWRIIGFGKEAFDHCERLRSNGVRIGTMDLRIAAIALANRATLPSANLSDFRRVPGLQVESWI